MAPTAAIDARCAPAPASRNRQGDSPRPKASSPSPAAATAATIRPIHGSAYIVSVPAVVQRKGVGVAEPQSSVAKTDAYSTPRFTSSPNPARTATVHR
ncbi:hypothetical protein EQG64_10775 [Streptomyces sp. S6]|nr:hypothetical protein EQG64_10775 [Streptomyces sp. S6]